MAFNLVLTKLTRTVEELINDGARVLLTAPTVALDNDTFFNDAIKTNRIFPTNKFLTDFANGDPLDLVHNYVLYRSYGIYVVTAQFTNLNGTPLLAQRPMADRQIITTTTAMSGLFLLNADGSVEPLKLEMDHTTVLAHARRNNLLMDPATVKLLPKRAMVV